MGAKSALRTRFQQEVELAEKEGRKPTSKIIKVPDDKRPTKESDENLGKNIAWSIKQNSGSGYYR